MAMARQQEPMSDESPKEVHNDDEQPPRSESKRKKFRPFRAVRNMFRKRIRRQGSENLQDYKKSRSTTELQNDEDGGGRRLSSPNSSYSVGLSVSHDSIFSPDHATTSLDPQELRNVYGFLSVQHVELKDLKDELFARIRARRDSDDEDAGLPHSPCTSPTTADILSQNLKSKSGISRTTCSEGSLISMGSSENDEDLTGMVLSSHSSRMSLLDKRFQDSDELDVSQPVPLSHKAAHHKIAVRPKRTHGLPRHRKQQLAASRLGSLPSTPEISEDSGKPSSNSLQSSEIFLSDTENMGMTPQSTVSSSLDFTKKLKSPGDIAVSGSVTNSSLSPNEQPIKSPKSSVFSSPEATKWYEDEMSESACSIEGKATSPNEENKSPDTPSNEKEIVNRDRKTLNEISDSPEDKSEKETNNVFSTRGTKVRKTDLDKQEKVSKNDHDEEPFLSRWFGSRRSNRANKRNADECSSTPSPKDEVKPQEKQVSPEADTNCSDKNEEKMKKGSLIEKKNLFLNLDVNSVHNGTGWRNFIQSRSDSPKEKVSQNIIGLENFSNKQVVKSSSDDCVHYSLNGRKPQDNKATSQGLKSKTTEKHQESGLESKAPASNLTTWADLKHAQNLKQNTVSSNSHKESPDMACKEAQRISPCSQTTDKVSQCERPSSLDITKKGFDYENCLEANNSCPQWKQNLKNSSINCKQDILNGTSGKDIFTAPLDVEKPGKNVESPILNRLRIEPKEMIEKNWESNKTNIQLKDNENKMTKPSTILSTTEKIPKSHSLDNGFDHPADSTDEQSHIHNLAISNSKRFSSSNGSNGPSRFKLRSTNSISKGDVVKAQSSNNGNICMIHKSPDDSRKSSPDLKCSSKKDTDVDIMHPSLVEQNKNGSKLFPRQSEEVCKGRNEKQSFQAESSLPPNSELFSVFARRSIKQKNNDKDKQNKVTEAAESKCVNGQETLNAESKCVQKTPPKDKVTDKDIRDKVTDKDNSETLQNEKVGAIQEIFIPRPRIVPASVQPKESNSEKRTQRNSVNDITQEIHIPRPRSHTTSEPSQSNDSTPEMRTRKSSVPESSKQALVKSKEEPFEEAKTGRAVNDRDKSKSFKLSNTRNSPPDARSADDNIQPSWLRLAQQRREQREQKEKQLLGSSSPQTSETISKPARSTKVLDMVSNFQKLQMT